MQLAALRPKTCRWCSHRLLSDGAKVCAQCGHSQSWLGAVSSSGITIPASTLIAVVAAGISYWQADQSSEERVKAQEAVIAADQAAHVAKNAIEKALENRGELAASSIKMLALGTSTRHQTICDKEAYENELPCSIFNTVFRASDINLDASALLLAEKTYDHSHQLMSESVRRSALVSICSMRLSFSILDGDPDVKFIVLGMKYLGNEDLEKEVMAGYRRIQAEEKNLDVNFAESCEDLRKNRPTLKK